MISESLKALGIESINPGCSSGTKHWKGNAEMISSHSPVDGQSIGAVHTAGESDYEKIISEAQNAFAIWRNTPAPKRGEIVRQMGDALRKNKDHLGRLVSYEMGKSLQEGWGKYKR